MTPEAQRLVDELKAATAIAVRERDDDHSSDDFVIQRIWDQVDKLASMIPAGGLAEEARDAARWRAIRDATGDLAASAKYAVSAATANEADRIADAIDSALSAPTPQQEQPR